MRDAQLTVTEEDKRVLKILSEYIYWAGRYPAAKSVNHEENLWNVLNIHLFGGKQGEEYVPKPEDMTFSARKIDDDLSWDRLNPIWAKLLGELRTIGGRPRLG